MDDIIIVGSGPAGLTAALYCARAQLQTRVITGPQPGGQLMTTSWVENWPGDLKTTGPQLMQRMLDQAQESGALLTRDAATKVDKVDSFFKITGKKDTYTAKAVIIATGATPRRLQCPGEEEYWTKGVTTCAVCDGIFFKDQDIMVVGGGDSAMHTADFMKNIARSITIVHIGPSLTGSRDLQHTIKKIPHLTIMPHTTVKKIEGNGKHVTHAILVDEKTQEERTHATNAIFVNIGLIPNTEMVAELVDRNSYHYILVENDTNTRTPGLFAAGDVVDYHYRQAITASGNGCQAALNAIAYLSKVQ